MLVGLLRETRRGRGGPASKQLETLADMELRGSVHVLCEPFTRVELSDRGMED